MALMKMAKDNGVPEVYIHGLLGRRGERPEAGAAYMEDVEKEFYAGGEPAKLVNELDAIDADTRDIRIYLRGTISSWLEMRQFLHDLRERIGGGEPA
jgi:bisphosphoglycerate-independent phosphoglycerate mutase (AlkP superfamily)